VSEDVAKRMLENAEGDVDAAVMLIVEHQELEKEEKGPRESDGGVRCRKPRPNPKKSGSSTRSVRRTSPAEFFLGCSSWNISAKTYRLHCYPRMRRMT
jgi:hypothetical protein